MYNDTLEGMQYVVEQCPNENPQIICSIVQRFLSLSFLSHVMKFPCYNICIIGKSTFYDLGTMKQIGPYTNCSKIDVCL